MVSMTYVAAFEALPWQVAPWNDTAPIVLLTGSAGGGKSRLAAEKVNGFMKRYPGAMGLALRKTRESMTNSTVLFFERRVAGDDPAVQHVASKRRFEYTNGSILAYGGMADQEQREQVRSIGLDAGLDICWMEEAHLFTEDDFQELLPRMRGKAADWSQIILTTNPDAPLHWINRRLIAGKEAAIYYSHAADNPYNPPEYAKWLGMLTGVYHERLVKGLWVQAEGAVFDNFDPRENVGAEAEYNPDLDVYWGCDDGYAEQHPRVVLLAQVTPMGGLHVFGEYYRALVPTHLETVREVLGWPYPQPRMVYVDSSSPIFRRAITDESLYNFGATHPVSEGIKLVRGLICDGQGVRLLKIHPRCTNLVREMQSYRYDTGRTVQAGEPQVVKADDHAVDALRYLVYGLRNEF